ncbi:hypothetical protein NX862_17455 [Rhodobacter sp. KR11]|uniref:hypothetical protein n=1 Tax=Rhodobacter sp. KR11 TaxID=2974588 RepID=UPI00222208C7|nr:hypothetical protein [Rhodobacter sp. KR11]MCW1920548.1 hypothetical protein [Rhodobacter sp. KR11]
MYLKRSEVATMVASATEFSTKAGHQDRGAGAIGSAVLAVGCEAGLVAQLGALFAAQGHVLIRCRRLIDVQSRQWFSRTWALHHVSHLLVDVAALGGLARCRQGLRRIKDLMPDLPFILVDDDRAIDLDTVGHRLLSRWAAPAFPRPVAQCVKMTGKLLVTL